MLNIKICLNGGKYEDKTYYCQYFEKSIYLGEVDNNQVLVKLNELNEIIESHKLNNFIDIDVELLKINEYKELKTKLDQVLSSIKIDHNNLKYL